jgi:hypothetical protein
MGTLFSLDILSWKPKNNLCEPKNVETVNICNLREQQTNSEIAAQIIMYEHASL